MKNIPAFLPEFLTFLTVSDLEVEVLEDFPSHSHKCPGGVGQWLGRFCKIYFSTFHERSRTD